MGGPGEKTSYFRRSCYFHPRKKCILSQVLKEVWLSDWQLWCGRAFPDRQSNLSRHLSQGQSAGVALSEVKTGVREG